LSNDLNAEISISRVRISPFSGVQLTNFLLRDQQKDTLFFAKDVRAGIERFSFLRKHLYIGKVRFQSPVIHLYEHDERMNFTFLLDSLGKNRPDTMIWAYSMKGLVIRDGSIEFAHSLLEHPNAIKNKLTFSGLELEVNRISALNDSLVFEVSNFMVREEIGLAIESFRTRGYLHDDRIEIRDLSFRTGQSVFDFDFIELPLKREDSLGYEIPFRGKANRIIIAPEEVQVLYPGFPVLESPLTFSGLIFGSFENLKGRNVRGGFGNNSHIVANFDINGLSDFNQAFVYMDIESFQTTVSDLELLIPGTEPLLPKSFQALQTIRYKGNITGFVNDLVAFGTFSSGLGSFSTDIGVKLQPDKELIFAGLLSTKSFHLGRLLNLEANMGLITLDMELSGRRRSPSDYFLLLDGNIGSMKFNDYLYSNIMVQGLLMHQKFDGVVQIDDPNGALDFLGTVDMSGKVPRFNFTANLSNVQLDRLQIYPALTDGVLSVKVETNFEGDNVDDLVGEIVLRNGLIYSPKGAIDFDSISVKALRYGNLKQLQLTSPFADGLLTGRYSFRNVKGTVLSFVDNYLPSLITLEKQRVLPGINDFEFNVDFKEMSQLVSLFVPDLQISDKGRLNGHFTSDPPSLELDAAIDYLNYQNVNTQILQFTASSEDKKRISLAAFAGKASIGKFVDMVDFSIIQNAGNDSLQTNAFWNNWESNAHRGAIFTTTVFTAVKDGIPKANLTLRPSAVVVADSIWSIHESHFSFNDKGMSVRGFRVEHAGQFVTLNGFLHREDDDGLQLVFNRLNIESFLMGNIESKLSFAGTMDGELHLSDYFRDPLLAGDFKIYDFVFNNTALGTLQVNSNWNRELEAMTVSTVLGDEKHKTLRGFGLFHPKAQHADFQFDVDSLDVSFLNPFLSKVVQDIKGYGSGKMYFKGPLSQPYLTGRINLDRGGFGVDMLNTTYSLSDTVVFYPNEIRFKDMTIADRNGRQGRFRGSIYHAGNFSSMIYNLRLEANNMLLLNTRLRDNPLYYGTVYGTGNMSVTGNTDNLNIVINGRSRPNTRFFIPMQTREVAMESNFIRFVPQNQAERDPGYQLAPQEYNIDLSGIRVDMDIEVTPDAEVQIIFDERIGDILRGSGSGNIQMRIDRQGNIRFFGEYTIQEGEYLFSLQNLINKRFTINQGGTVKWQGDPYNADIDIMAVYRLKASLSDLVPTTANGDRGSSDFQRRVQIHCNLMLTGALQQPNVRFGLEMPTLDESRESLILDYISSEEELNRQVLSLLILNRFFTPEHLRASEGNVSRYDNTALLTTTEMLSSQVSRWFSSISSDVDVGVAYRPGDNITSEEFELALSTQVFNNRVSINGNVGYGKYHTSTSKMIGDFDVDMKLNRSGTIRARAYTRSNEDLIYEAAPTTQGIGLSFKEEFDEFRELMRKYRHILLGKKDEEVEL
jgi:hypothetical protein